MKSLRFALVLAFALGTLACNRSQPSGVPDSTVAVPAPEAETKAPESPPEQAPVRELKQPPPLDSDIPPIAKTGFPDCDNFIEEYRQCLNSHLAGDDRKTAAQELTSSVNSIVGNIGRGVEPSRVVSRCKRARRLAAPNLEKFGCSMQMP